ncbi:MAG: protein translocase subunit SecD [Myxococcota bacterium]|nr:protein translocase subunit SecD [Myxococcota bacterium]
MSTILLSLLVSIWLLLPTFMGKQDMSAMAEGVQSEDSAELAEDETWWEGLLPDSRLNLGLDLQGGIDLTLDVDMDEAVLSMVARDAQPMLSLAEDEGIAVKDIRRMRGEPILEVELAPGTDISDFRANVAKKFPEYSYEGEHEGVYHFHLTEEARAEIEEGAIEQAVEMLRNRVDETGVKEPQIVRKGNRRINVQLPGVSDAKQAIDVLGTTALLEFYMVDEQFQPAAVEEAVKKAKKAMEAAGQDYSNDQELNYWLQDNGLMGQGNVLMWQYADTAAELGSGNYNEQRGDRWATPLMLQSEVILSGDDINDAQTAYDQNNQPVVSMEFKPRGAKIFAKVTTENVNKRFAIVLDKELQSAPNINEPITGGRAQISMGTGGFEQKSADASKLSLVLRTGALPAPITVGEVRVVGASLGADAIEDGSEAVLIGGILVIVFMVIYYRKPGLVATVGLSLNVFFVLAMLALFDATLTLPGIAGIALTVGMAVDANIIIYERIREELALGRNPRKAVETGYAHALSAVMDANITTGIAGVVLYSYGTGPIKGFAVTLLIGILTTLFTAIFVSRTLMDFLVRKSTARLAF